MYAYQLQFDNIDNLPVKIESQDEFGKRYETVLKKENNRIYLFIKKIELKKLD